MKIPKAFILLSICLSSSLMPTDFAFASDGGLSRDCNLNSTARWVIGGPKYKQSLIETQFKRLNSAFRLRGFESQGIHIFEAYPMGHGQGICAFYWVDKGLNKPKPNDSIFSKGLSTVTFKSYPRRFVAKATL